MLNYLKSTDVFTEKTCPNSLLTSHKINNGFFGILNVLSGNLIFIYDDTNEKTLVDNSKPFFIEPNRLHHLKIDKTIKIRVDFYKIKLK